MTDDTATTPADDRPTVDPDDVRLATDPPAPLRDFNRAGVLGPADVHGARTLARLARDERPEVLLGAALALRAPQHGHVCVELSGVASTATLAEDSPVGADELVWPDADHWRTVLADSRLVRVRGEGTPLTREELAPEDDRPLVLVGDRLYLDRYWRYERRVAEVLRRRAARTDEDVDPDRVRAVLDRLLPPGTERPDRQRLAVATGALRGLTVVAGGPGTGKTHTVARLLALLLELADDWPRVAVAAPTGKAADRLTAALRAAAADERLDVSEPVRARLMDLTGSTLHRLLGWHPGSATRFRHDRNRRLPHEVVVVDETSMVDLSLMSKLLEALRSDTRLVLVGDPDQLASVEAGAVLADIVGPSDDRLRMTPATRDRLVAATGEPLDDTAVDLVDAGAAGIDDAVVVLGTVRRFGADSGIARLARAIHAGDGDAAVDVLRSGASDVTWVEATGEARDGPALRPVRGQVAATGRAVVEAAGTGDAETALAALERFRVLCAHRRGAVGVGGWIPLVERWLTTDVDGFEPWPRFHVGQPVMVTRNDARLKLFNGDVGVVVRAERGSEREDLQVAFPGATGPRRFAPSRLEDLETVHAMTIHKSQGSQFDHVVVVLPEESQVLTRELLYTAATRARSGVTVVATEAAVRGAITRRVARASGLRATLWPDASPAVPTSSEGAAPRGRLAVDPGERGP